MEDERVDHFVGKGVFLVEEDTDEEGVGTWGVSSAQQGREDQL